MIYLCFGMPGTGKSTFCRSKKYHVTVDLGHNAFKSEEQREKFYKKMQRTTGEVLSIVTRLSPSVNIYVDTYPEYYAIKDILKLSQGITIVFAIPDETTLEEVVLPRVARRDGNDEFCQLYATNYKKWRTDMIKTFNEWKSLLGKSKVHLISLYDVYGNQ